ncbi:MAG: CHAP domain-containing protein, partial [Acetobacteraceae bacterium]
MGWRARFRNVDLLASFLVLPLLFVSPAPAMAGPSALKAPAPVRPRAVLHRIRYHFVSCVPYARRRSGVSLPGNAWQWWGNAAGHYARGHNPAYGSVMVFRAIARMPLGHVAVVSRIVNAREVLVDQANWIPAGQIRLGVPVVDVSRDNDWSE